MKFQKFLLPLCLTVSSLTLRAATLESLNEGHNNADFSLAYVDTDKSDANWGVAVGDQYFIRDDLAIGGALGLAGSAGTRLQYVLAPSITYYFAHLDSAAPFIEGGVFVSQGVNDNKDSTGVFGRVGLAYFLTQQVAVKSAVNLQHESFSNEDVNSFSIVSGFSIFF